MSLEHLHMALYAVALHDPKLHNRSSLFSGLYMLAFPWQTPCLAYSAQLARMLKDAIVKDPVNIPVM